MKQFSKVKYLERVGLLHERFNYELLEFEPSFILSLNSHLALFIKVTWPLKLFVSLFWPRRHIAQLYIGNIYNYLDDGPRVSDFNRLLYRMSHSDAYFQFAIGLVGVILAFWLVSIHLCFNCLLTRNDNHLLKVWMRLSYEIPAKTDRDYQGFGLSAAKNKGFWEAEDDFNVRFSRILNCSMFISCFIFPVQLFFVR